MSPAGTNSFQGPKRDLVDYIAERLPSEARTEYYRVLRHCRTLPESDEILRILNAMQLLTILIYDAPTDILRLGEDQNARIVFSGDTSQIQSVEAVDALRILERESRMKTVP